MTRRGDSRQFKPFEGLFQRPKHLDLHASIHSNGFPIPCRVTKGLKDNIGKPRRESVFMPKPHSFSGREFAVQKAFEVSWLSIHVPTIKNYFFGLVLSNTSKHFQKDPFCLLQRELSACLNLEKT